MNNKLKGFFVVENDYSISFISKIRAQVRELNKISSTSLIAASHKKITILQKILRRLPCFSLYDWKKLTSMDHSVLYSADCDFLYVRKPGNIDGKFLDFLRKSKTDGVKRILLEIPTYPYNGELKGGILILFLLLKDKKYRRRLKKYVDRIITFSDDQIIFGIPTININNAVDTNTIRPVIYKKANDRINLIACSCFSYWHGYDRILEGMHNYNGKRKFLFHIVGNGNELKKYQNMVRKYGLEEDVCFHGYLSGSTLDEVYNCSDIGLDSMGRHRSGVFYNSTLKSKEYLAKGLPVVSGVCGELDDRTDFKYYMRVPADDSPVNMGQIADFYDRIYGGTETREEIVNYISDYAKENFSFEVAFKPVLDYISSTL